MTPAGFKFHHKIMNVKFAVFMTQRVDKF